MFKKGGANAETFTLAFWVKSNLTGNAQVNLRDKDNTRMISSAYSISSANTWEHKVLNFAKDETGAFGDLKENTIALNNLIDRIYDDYITQRISGLRIQISFLDRSKNIDSFSESLGKLANLIWSIKNLHDHDKIETQESWVSSKLGSLIKMMDYDIKDLQRQVDALI